LTVFFLAFGVLHYQTCRKFALQPDEYEDDAHHIDVLSGHLYKPTEKDWIKHADYCIDFYDNGDDNDTEKLTTFACFSTEYRDNEFWLKPVLVVVSTICLGLTLLTFLILPSVSLLEFALLSNHCSSSVTASQHRKESRHPLRRIFVRRLLIPVNQLAILDRWAWTFVYNNGLSYVPRISCCVLLAGCHVL
jgi:hypothetical protein